jgi:DNA mismatch repair ATPase MutS
MLQEHVRVANDVRLGPPGSFMLVTGSNMSGKSTLLRAIGVNVVLAQAGGPVCATSLCLRPTRLFTSMPVRDSLARGVSHFMAGLLRLKTIVEAAREALTVGDGDSAAGRGPRTLYLFDELLQGTNSAEREVAVRNVICEMLSLGAVGAVTTHDLALAEMPELTAAMRAVHFSESIEEVPADGGESVTTMSFDYKLRPGVATSRNALRLMEIMGLGGGGERRSGGPPDPADGPHAQPR